MWTREKMLLWFLGESGEYLDSESLKDHEKLKALSEIYSHEKFGQYLDHLCGVLIRKIALKAEGQEQVWFLRGRLFQLQLLRKSLKEAHLKKVKLETSIKVK